MTALGSGVLNPFREFWANPTSFSLAPETRLGWILPRAVLVLLPGCRSLWHRGNAEL